MLELPIQEQEESMETVTSKDGTRIAYDRTGNGEPVILVAGAFSYRKYSGQVKVAELLSPHFTVLNYDRRGRGDSGDTPPYGVEREIEDLEALLEAVGGSAYAWGLSSGAALSLRAAAAAVKYFMTEGMGAPSFVVSMLKVMPGVWPKLTAVAHTLPYDALLVEGYQTGRPLPAREWDSVTMPTLVMSGTERESPAALCHSAAAVASALPDAQLIVRKGLGHAKKLTPKVIASTLAEFFGD